MLAANTTQKNRKFSAATNEAQIEYLNVTRKERKFSAATNKTHIRLFQIPRKKSRIIILHTHKAKNVSLNYNKKDKY
jgi:hypothetical protein